MNTHTWSFLGWEVIPRDGKFYCEQGFNECMRLGADGSVGIGDSRIVLKSYEFLTREWAEACVHRMEEMDRAPAPTLSWVASGRYDIRSWGSNRLDVLEFRSNQRPIVVVDSERQIKHLDLPFLVWVWLRNSALARGLKRLWYGERGMA